MILTDSRQATSVEIIKSILYNGFAKIIKILLERFPQDVLEADDEDEILPTKQLLRIIQFCQSSSLIASHDLLVHKNRQTFQILLQYHDLTRNQNVKREEQTI